MTPKVKHRVRSENHNRSDGRHGVVIQLGHMRDDRASHRVARGGELGLGPHPLVVSLPKVAGSDLPGWRVLDLRLKGAHLPRLTERSPPPAVRPNAVLWACRRVRQDPPKKLEPLLILCVPRRPKPR